MRLVIYRLIGYVGRISVILLFGLAFSIPGLPDDVRSQWNTWIGKNVPPPIMFSGSVYPHSENIVMWVLILFVFVVVVSIAMAPFFRDLARADTFAACGKDKQGHLYLWTVPALCAILFAMLVYGHTHYLIAGIAALPVGFMLVRRITGPMVRVTEALNDEIESIGLKGKGDISPSTPRDFYAEGAVNGIQITVEKTIWFTIKKNPDGSEYGASYVTTVECSAPGVQMNVRPKKSNERETALKKDEIIVENLVIQSKDLHSAKELVNKNINALKPVMEQYYHLSLNVPYKKFSVPFLDRPYFVAVGYYLTRENLELLASLSAQMSQN